jgi:hypothetical protein
MIVRSKAPAGHSFLTAGKDYFVLGLDAQYFRIVDDEGFPALYPCYFFTVVDETMPPDWVWWHVSEDTFYADFPEASERAFYDRLWECDKDAVIKFASLVQRLGLNSLLHSFLESRGYRPLDGNTEADAQKPQNPVLRWMPPSRRWM